MISSTTKFLCRRDSKIIWKASRCILRMSSGESCPSPPPCPCPPPKPEPAPEPPPCPKLPPPCPPPMCPKVPDPGNPCNYCPPACIDPDLPDLRRLKRNQCKFQVGTDPEWVQMLLCPQQDDGLPVFLKGGPKDVIMYQGILILTILGLCYSTFALYKMS